jgi:hypothetical protein
VTYFFIVVYSFYCDLKGVDSSNAPNTSHRPVVTEVSPGGNKYVETPFIQGPTVVLPQAPLYEGDIDSDYAGRNNRADTYYSIPEVK